MENSTFDVFSEIDKEQEKQREKNIEKQKQLAQEKAQKEHDEFLKSGKSEVELEKESLNEANSIKSAFSAQLSNQEAFDALIKGIRDSSNTARDYGTKFETLTKDWITKDNAYKDLFLKVQTFKEWAIENPKFASNAKDTGIDLVGTNADDGLFTAIQCKMYELGHKVSKADIDSFVSASDKEHFTKRFIVATNQNWSDNVLNDLKDKRVPVTVITHSDLASSNVDWSAYAKGQVANIKTRKLRTYQREAINKVMIGFKEHNRGKLIMACGTGKTFTSMKLVESYLGAGGFVLFLVPSLSLLSQTLADWKRNCAIHINAFAVCSDTSTGKADASDIDSLTEIDQLSYPATTNAEALYKQITKALSKQGDLTVIFSTYQSIEVISKAQELGMPELDLTICDEAHRTAGVSFTADDKESNFVKVHDNDFLKSKNRLYMTATPKIYGSNAKEQQSSGEIVLYSMDDESTFGPQFDCVSFTTAIDMGCLVDYKVIVLTLDESLLEADYDFITTGASGGLSVSNAAKIVGSWRALTKIDLQNEKTIDGDILHMKRAVGFAQVIEPSEKYDRPSSKQFAKYYNDVVENYKAKEKEFLKKRFKSDWKEEVYNESHKLQVETKHIDGSMNATEKDSLLAWLREEPKEDTCKILFNVRCLSEGVDVPSLDAVIFLSPRKSQVDVVQTVGRVMRIAKGKQRGYVILPIVVPTGVAPELVLNNNKDFDVVWQILNALKSIDPTFGRAIDGETGKINPDRIEVISISDNKFSHKQGAGSTSSNSGKGKKKKGKEASQADGGNTQYQTSIDFGTDRDIYLEEEIKAKLVKKVGNRYEWSDWAEEVGEICQTQIKHIKKVVNESAKSKKALENFIEELKATLNGELTEDSVIEMLGQHVVIKPVLEALFKEYPFADENPISKAMTEMLSKLDKAGMNQCIAMLDTFYRDVQRRMENATDSETRQTLIKDLFDKFFKVAFPKMRDKLGIVYTPIEIVDFINKSVDDLLKKEFGKSIADHDLHILDPFTGTGSFIVRLMQSGLINKQDLKYKYEHDLHANEIVPLAYYIASMNMETAYHEIVDDADYKPNEIMLWTDTFADNKESDIFTTSLSENNKKQIIENNADIKVIIGNPPYSVGQESQNDDNANEHYGVLDKRLQDTYVERSNATLKGKLFDSYIRAYRWASDRIGDSGIVAFITNAGWLDSSSADGMRKCMVEEFSSIYIYHLKGNARTSGEQRRKEKDNVFGEGSRAPVAIVFLVKNPKSEEKGKIYFHEVADYLTREQKLSEISKYGSIAAMEWNEITPDKHGDWLNQRDDSYYKFIRTDGKKSSEKAIFKNCSAGVLTSRDSWIQCSSSEQLEKNVNKMTEFYNNQVLSYKDKKTIDLDKTKMSWDERQKRGVKNGETIDKYNSKYDFVGLYRPFFKQHVYYNRFWNARVYQMPTMISCKQDQNILLVVSGIGGKDFSCCATDTVADYQLMFNGQCFSRYLYIDGEKIDSISDEAFEHFKSAYGSESLKMTKDDIFYYIYGIFHSIEYRNKYANNLSKELPRIPRVENYEQFKIFSEAGRKLAELHVNYENQPEYPNVRIEGEESGNYYVQQMKWAKIPGKTGNAAKNKTTLIYNSDITIYDIPLEAQEYVVNKKSALDWVVERACYTQDKKTGIVNDFNQYGLEKGEPRYPLSLFLKVLTVSMETVKIVKSLPKLEIHPLDKD